ncbi:methionyl-tRNA formyltransferase [Candidatus Parcubacteria bacterium]|nr:MAG: methionyl-tRNA formyltransferase [Candidatus Parcubacteria bacterium]
MNNIVFFGSSEYSVIAAKTIHTKIPISLTITLTDRPNKKGALTPNPVKVFAQENNIPVITTNKLDEKVIEEIQKKNPDFLIVADFGLILPQKLLNLPKYAPLNIHHSLLPQYKGPSPAPTAILNGDKITGVTVIKITDKVDAGNILAQKEYEIKENETTASLLKELNKLGGEIIIPVIEFFVSGNIQEIKQNESKATYTKFMKKTDGLIDPENPPDPNALDRMTRAYFPWPNVWFKTNFLGKEKIIKILPDKKIQVEGKNIMTHKDFINGYQEEGKATLRKLKLIE